MSTEPYKIKKYSEIVAQDRIKDRKLATVRKYSDVVNEDKQKQMLLDWEKANKPGFIESAIKTVGNTATNIGKAVVGTVEDVADFGMGVGSAIGNFVSTPFKSEESRARTRDKIVSFIERDLTDELMTKVGWTPEMKKEWENGSLVKENNIAGKTAQAAGGLMMDIITGDGLAKIFKFTPKVLTATKGLKGLTKAKTLGINAIKSAANPTTIFRSARGIGGNLEQAYQGGATDIQAMKFAVTNTVGEVVTEMLVGGIPGTQSIGIFDDIGKNIAKFGVDRVKKEGTKQLINFGSQLGFKMVGEGAEEAIQEVLSAVIEKSTFNSEKEIWNGQEILEAALVGGLLGGIFEAPSTFAERASINLETIKNEEKQVNPSQSANEKVDNTTPQTTTEANENVSTDLDTLDTQIKQIKEELTTIARPETIDMEGLYKKLTVLEEQRNALATQLSEQEQIDKVKEISEATTELNEIPQEMVTPEVEAFKQDSEDFKKKVIENLEKAKVLKPLENKQKIKLIKQELTQEAEGAIEFYNTTMADPKQQAQILYELTSEQQQVVDIGEAFGKQVVFVDNPNFSGMVIPANSNILFIGNDINSSLLLTSNKNTAMLYTVGHELFHSLKLTSPEVYNDFVAYIKTDVTTEQIIAFMQKYDPTDSQGMLKRYQNIETKEEALNQIVEEMVANEFGAMITDVNYMTNLHTKNEPLFKKIVTAIKKLLGDLTAPVYDSSLTQLQITKIRDDFEAIVALKPEVKKEPTIAKKEVIKQEVKKQTLPKKENIVKKETVKEVVKKPEVKEEKLPVEKVEPTKVVKEEKTKLPKKKPNDSLKLTPEEEARLTELANKPIVDTTATVTKMDVESRLKYINTTLDRSNKETNSKNKNELLKAATRAYENYKKDGGVAVINELETKAKTDLKQALKERGVAVKGLPRNEKIEVDNSRNNLRTKESITDNTGKKLTKQQQKKFKDSKVRDENGNLLRVFHGSRTDGTFNTFIKGESGAFFFVDDIDVAKTYATNSNKIYNVFLNIKNPYIIDAKGSHWSEIPLPNKINTTEIESKINNIKNNILTILNKYEVPKSDIDTFMDEVQQDLIGEDGKLLNTQYIMYKLETTLRQYVNKPSSVEYNEFRDKLQKDIELVAPINTDAIAKYAKEQGYDGVIIKNIIDGGSLYSAEKIATNYIVFNSNQIKKVDNLNPTESNDIRYLPNVSSTDKENKAMIDYFEKYRSKNKIDNMNYDVMWYSYSESTPFNEDDYYTTLKNYIINERKNNVKNGGIFNGEPFWSGAVNVLDGYIEEIHTFDDAKDADFNHSLYFSQQQVDKLDEGINAFFWVEDGKLHTEWREQIPKNIINKLKEQIIIKTNNQTTINRDTRYLPKNDNKMKTSDVSKTVIETGFFPDVENEIKKNPRLAEYRTVTNESDEGMAIEYIKEKGADVVNDYIQKQRTDSYDVATGKLLMEFFKAKQDVKNELAIYTTLQDKVSRSGQTLQAMNAFKNLSPVAKVAKLTAELNALYVEMAASQNKTTQSWLKEHNVKFNDAETRWAREMFEKADRLDPDSREYKQIMALVQSYVESRTPKSIAKKLKAFRRMSMLGNLKTAARNFSGNVPMAIINAFVTDPIRAAVDARIAKTTGVRTAAHTKEGMKVFFKNWKQGIGEAVNDYKLGIRTGQGGVAFETQPGRTFKSKSLNKGEELVNLMMDATDRGFDKGSYEQSLYNIMTANNVTEATETMKQMAFDESQKRTYKNNGKMATAALGTRRLLNGIIGVKDGKFGSYGQQDVDFGLGDMLLPFAMTPANLVVAMYDYSPAATISVYKRAVEFKKAVNALKGKPANIKLQQEQMIAQKALVDSIGRVGAGFILWGLAAALVKSGRITGGRDEDKEVAAMMKEAGFQEFSIDLGDGTYWSFDWAQPFSGALATMAELKRQGDRRKLDPNKSTEAENMFKVITEAFTIGTDRLYEQSFLQSIKNVFSAQTPQEGIVNFMADIPASFVPTLSKQLADAIDRTDKNYYNKDNVLATMINKLLVKVPFAKSTLPTKKNVLGNNVYRQGGSVGLENWFHTFINPSNIAKNVTGEVGNEIMDLYNRTGERGIMPYQADKYIDFDSDGDGKIERISFDLDQQMVLQETMGKQYAETMEQLINDSVYMNATDEEKVKAITGLTQYVKRKALVDSGFIPNYTMGESTPNTIQGYVDTGLLLPEATVYYGTVHPITPQYDEITGKAISGTRQGQQAYKIMNMLISDESKNVMLDLITEGKTSETVDSLSKLSTQQQFIDYYSLNRSDVFVMDNYSRDDYDVATTAFNMNGSDYMKYSSGLSDIRTIKDANGKEITSKKSQVVNYINKLPISTVQKVFLYSTAGYSIKQYRSTMYEYINSLDMTKDEKKRLWTLLGFK